MCILQNGSERGIEMKHTFDVRVRCVTYLHATVEADEFEEAYDIASYMDGGEFTEEAWGSCEWDICSIEREDGETVMYY